MKHARLGPLAGNSGSPLLTQSQGQQEKPGSISPIQLERKLKEENFSVCYPSVVSSPDKDVKLLKTTDACTVYCLESHSYKLNTVDTELILYYQVYCFSTSVIPF